MLSELDLHGGTIVQFHNPLNVLGVENLVETVDDERLLGGVIPQHVLNQGTAVIRGDEDIGQEVHVLGGADKRVRATTWRQLKRRLIRHSEGLA